jgi:hypothetical protein
MIFKRADKICHAAIKVTIAIVICLTMIFQGCDNGKYPLSETYAYSFENSSEEWVEGGISLDKPLVDWAIEVSNDISNDGVYSIMLYLNNIIEESAIWIERYFNLKPSCRYNIKVEYDFASADWSDENLWLIITSALPAVTQIKASYQGNTGNGATAEDGFVWTHKSYNFIATTSSNGQIYINIGVQGLPETARTYYLDNIRITFTNYGQINPS